MSKARKIKPSETPKKQAPHRRWRKFLWLRCYLDESNKDTYLNAKNSAIAAGYGIKSASFVGYQHKKHFYKVIAQHEAKLQDRTWILGQMRRLAEAKKTIFLPGSNRGEYVEKVVDALEIQAKMVVDLAKAEASIFRKENEQLKQDATPVNITMDFKSLRDAIGRAGIPTAES